MTDILKTAFEANRKLWNELAVIHRQDATGFYRVEEFLNGKDVLYPIEAAEIGDISGLRVAHLQCHFGMDSICLARRGAFVTGIDFSPAAILEARRLAERTGVEADFVEGSVYDARGLVEGDFDMVYTTWGTIVWLPDVVRWARVVASLLKPGGFLYFADTHPALLCLEQTEGQLVLRHDWRTFADKPVIETGETSYTGDATTQRESYEWMHPLSEILNALIGAGLRLDWVHEHETLPWQCFPEMLSDEERMFRLPDSFPKLPLALSLKVTKG